MGEDSHLEMMYEDRYYFEDPWESYHELEYEDEYHDEDDYEDEEPSDQEG